MDVQFGEAVVGCWFDVPLQEVREVDVAVVGISMELFPCSQQSERRLVKMGDGWEWDERERRGANVDVAQNLDFNVLGGYGEISMYELPAGGEVLVSYAGLSLEGEELFVAAGVDFVEDVAVGIIVSKLRSIARCMALLVHQGRGGW